MCGRFSLSGDLDFYAGYFGVDEVVGEALPPSWNVAPTDPVYVVSEHGGRRLLSDMVWGLLPHWAGGGSPHINAREETVASNPVFRDSFAQKRCLIPADGFYEWEPPQRGRVPHWVFRADGHPMAFAGIWASRRNPATGEWRRGCSIITTVAAGAVVPIHNRMPVILDPEVWAAWLDRDLVDPEAARSLLRPIDPDLLGEHPVSSQVNSVRNNGPDLPLPRLRETLF